MTTITERGDIVKTGDQIVQGLPWRWRVQGKIFIIGGLGYMFDAWDVALNGFLTPLVAQEFDLSAGSRSFVATANLVGMALGAIGWGAIADRLGRKQAFSVTLLIFAVFSVLAAVAPNYEIFLALRFLAGVGLGGCIPVDYALVSEFSPSKHRGRILTALDLWWPIGATMCGVASVLLLPYDGNWRWMLAMMTLPALLLFWIRRGVPESPIFLAKVGREADAREVIDDLVLRTGAPVEPYVIPPVMPDRRPSRGLGIAVNQLRLVWSFSPRITSVAWLLFVSIMVVYYAALSWMPTILKAQGLGSNGAFIGTTLMSAVGILGVVVSAILVDVVGRKWLLGVSAPIATAALVVFAMVFHVPSHALLAIAVFGFLIQVTIPVLYAYVAELYPTTLRASGFGWASSVSRVATGFSPILFGNVLWPWLGLPVTFAGLGVVVLAAVMWMAVAAPETMGRDLDGTGSAETPEPPGQSDGEDLRAGSSAGRS